MFSGHKEIITTLIWSATDVRQVNHALKDVLDRDVYYRINPEGEEWNVEMDESDNKVLERMQTDTRRFMQTPQVRVSQD